MIAKIASIGRAEIFKELAEQWGTVDSAGKLVKPYTPVALAVEILSNLDVLHSAKFVWVVDDATIAAAVLMEVSKSCRVIISVQTCELDRMVKSLRAVNESLVNGRLKDGTKNVFEEVQIIGYNCLEELKVRLEEKVTEMGMKFDVVVGNPPYNEESDLHKGKSKRSPVRLWEHFLSSGMDLLSPNGHLLFVTPSSWLGSTSSSHKLMKQYELVTANVSKQVKDSFPSVGGSMRFSWYHILNRKASTCPTIIFDDGPAQVNPFTMTFQPVRSTSAVDFSICMKMANSDIAPLNWVRRDQLKQSWPFEVVVHRAKSTAHGISVSTTRNELGYVFGTEDKDLAEAVAHNLNLKLYRHLMWVMRSGMALVSSFTKLPIPTTKMTDDELADLFGLTKLEREGLQ